MTGTKAGQTFIIERDVRPQTPDPTDDHFVTVPGLTINQQEQSDWVCYLFGNHPTCDYGLTWRPAKGQEPNWFWRWMQYAIFGNYWINRPEKR